MTTSSSHTHTHTHTHVINKPVRLRDVLCELQGGDEDPALILVLGDVAVLQTLHHNVLGSELFGPPRLIT